MALVQCAEITIKGEGRRLVEIINDTPHYVTCKEIDAGTMELGPLRVLDRTCVSVEEVHWLDVNDLRKQRKLRSWEEG